MDKFQDIKIVDLLTDRTERSSVAEGLRWMCLRLSARPPREWADYFVKAHQFPRHTMWRKNVRVQGDCVLIECAPEELQNEYLPYLKEDAVEANKQYREHLARTERNLAEMAAREAAEKQRLEAIKGRLKFD